MVFFDLKYLDVDLDLFNILVMIKSKFSEFFLYNWFLMISGSEPDPKNKLLAFFFVLACLIKFNSVYSFLRFSKNLLYLFINFFAKNKISGL